VFKNDVSQEDRVRAIQDNRYEVSLGDVLRSGRSDKRDCTPRALMNSHSHGKRPIWFDSRSQCHALPELLEANISPTGQGGPSKWLRIAEQDCRQRSV